MKEKVKTQCQTCVLPESSVIHLGINGNCNVCNSPSLFEHIYKHPDNKKLQNLIDQTKKEENLLNLIA